MGFCRLEDLAVERCKIDCGVLLSQGKWINWFWMHATEFGDSFSKDGCENTIPFALFSLLWLADFIRFCIQDFVQFSAGFHVYDSLEKSWPWMVLWKYKYGFEILHFHLHCILDGGLLMDIEMRWLCGVDGNVVIGAVGRACGLWKCRDLTRNERKWNGERMKEEK